MPLPKRIAVDTIVTFRNDEKSPIKVWMILLNKISLKIYFYLVSYYYVSR